MGKQAYTSPPPLESFAISLAGAATLLKCRREAIRMDVSRGNLPTFRVYGRREHYVKLDDLAAMLESRGLSFSAQQVRAYKLERAS